MNIQSSVKPTSSRPWPAPPSQVGKRIGVSPNKRYLIYQDGSPFFYLADTAWTLFKRLNHEELDRYFNNRVAKGFTVIQAYVLRGLEVRNLYGALPLVGRDPTKLDEAFFSNVDYAVKRANELGLVMGLVACMGEHVRHKEGSERYKDRNEQIFDVDNAFKFGSLLGKRYKGDAVIWLLGGDRTPSEADILVWDAMARGLKDGSQGTQLVSYHGSGGTSSSAHFHNFDWLDFNTIQSRHASADPNYEYVTVDYGLKPTKPTFDMESRYEDYPDGNAPGGHKIVYSGEAPPSLRIDAFQTREAAYWDVFAGGCGHGYGHNDIWQMADSKRTDSTQDYSFPYVIPRDNWYVSIDSPGAFGLSHLRKLVELRPWFECVPDQSVIASGQGSGEDHVQAMRQKDGGFILAYLTFGNRVGIDVSKLSGKRFKASWFDPREGVFAEIGTFANGGGAAEFVPPTSGRDNDWVLVVEDAGRGYRTE